MWSGRREEAPLGFKNRCLGPARSWTNVNLLSGVRPPCPHSHQPGQVPLRPAGKDSSATRGAGSQRAGLCPQPGTPSLPLVFLGFLGNPGLSFRS